VIRSPWVALYLACLFPPMVKAAAVAPQPISLDAYQQDLDRLQTVVAGCAQQLASKTVPTKACDPAQVGPDVAVSVPGGSRTVGYEWLRESLRQAGKSPETAGGLKAAGDRLLAMKQDAASLPSSPYVPGNVANIRHQLDEILASPDYPQPGTPSFLERLWLDFWQWLLKTILKAMPRNSSSTSIYLLELAVIAIPCGLLIWWFVRKLTVQRLDLTRDSMPDAAAPSAQPWDEWLGQAQRLAGESRWREAIHHVYWAAISYLESHHFWSADRARTPREYLGLLEANPDAQADLSSLTRRFESTWYGATPALKEDFDQACTVLERIAAR
jgi:hypothetical protein